MEKRAQIQSLGQRLKAAMTQAAAEDSHNIKVAAHNQKVLLTQTGEAKPYQKAAHLDMIKLANEVIETALGPET